MTSSENRMKRQFIIQFKHVHISRFQFGACAQKKSISRVGGLIFRIRSHLSISSYQSLFCSVDCRPVTDNGHHFSQQM